MDGGQRNKRKLADQARIRMKKFRLRKKDAIENLSSSNDSESSSSIDIVPKVENSSSPKIINVQQHEQDDQIEMIIHGMKH